MCKRIGVIMGGFTSERHISLESGRNIYSKLIASTKYDPLALFLSGSIEAYRIFTLPIFLLLQDNADDVHDFLLGPTKWKELKEILDPIRKEAKKITETYSKEAVFEPEELNYSNLKERVDFIFLALHGRPGEDGTFQELLEHYNIPYNGSGVQTTALAINKYATNQFLSQRGVHVPKQLVITKTNWATHSAQLLQQTEFEISYPLIAKPIDDGCSTGVVKITNRSMLEAYAIASFRKSLTYPSEIKQILKIQEKISLPKQSCFIVEEFIAKDEETLHCLEITTGLLTHVGENNATVYEIFEPSEVLAADTILSLEEKFLAGEGHNLTPARFHADKKISTAISQKVKIQLAHIAQLLHLQGYARIDAFLKIYPNHKIEVWVIEINTLPAMTPSTCIFHQSALNGYTPFDFIDAIIKFGFTKRNFSTFLPFINAKVCLKV